MIMPFLLWGKIEVVFENVTEVLKEMGIQVFCGKYEGIHLCGKNLYTYLNDVYQNKSQY